jgi:hypothetical protein
MRRTPPSSPSLTGSTLTRAPPELQTAATGVQTPDHDDGGSSSQPREDAARAPGRKRWPPELPAMGSPAHSRSTAFLCPAPRRLLSPGPPPLHRRLTDLGLAKRWRRDPHHRRGIRRGRVGSTSSMASRPDTVARRTADGDGALRRWGGDVDGGLRRWTTTSTADCDGGQRHRRQMTTSTADDVGRGMHPPSPSTPIGLRRGRIRRVVDRRAASLGQWWPAVPTAQ